MGFLNNIESIKNKIADAANDAKSKVVSTAKNASDNINFFGTIANLKEYAVVVVYYLRDNAPEKIMDIVSRMPVIGAAGTLGKFVLGRPMGWLNEQLIKSGEPYIMENLKQEWENKGITYKKIKDGIDNIPSAVFDDNVKSEIKKLLDRYYNIDTNDENVKSEISNNIEDTTLNMIKCVNCGCEMTDNSKFCPECGSQVFIQSACKSCGNLLDKSVKFCPECGTKVIHS